MPFQTGPIPVSFPDIRFDTGEYVLLPLIVCLFKARMQSFLEHEKYSMGPEK
jgi:hypothetical protein